MSEVRVCENCKAVNDISNLECEKCGFDLSFVVPIDENELSKKDKIDATSNVASSIESTQWVLESIDNQCSINIQNGTVIGRDGENGSYFEKSNFVSRKHAVFYIENNELLVFDASTNGTFLNGKRIDKLMKIPVKISDKITFADITFEVKNAD